ncbi:MAG: Hsp33 family molecular chaperone HslO [Polyangiaceae bacterium]
MDEDQSQNPPSGPKKEEGDTVLRAVTHDGSFRVVAVETTRTVRGAIAAQKVGASVMPLFADLLTASVLVRESMAPDLRVQIVLQGGDRRSRLVADSHPDGMTRGLVQLAPGKDSWPLEEGGVLRVQRSMQNGELHQGVVGVQSSANISSAFMAYMEESEQIHTMISIATYVSGGEVVAAGGYLLQLLPEVERQKLAVMTERLEDFRDIGPLLARGAASPKELLYETLYGMPYEQVAERGVHYGCNCSFTRLAASLASLPRKDVEELAASKEVLEISCDFCGQLYHYRPDQLRGLLIDN